MTGLGWGQVSICPPTQAGLAHPRSGGRLAGPVRGAEGGGACRAGEGGTWGHSGLGQGRAGPRLAGREHELGTRPVAGPGMFVLYLHLVTQLIQF